MDGLTLDDDLERLVRQKVESGLYPSADEVLREALQLLDERDRLRALKLEELREEIAIGIEQADRGQVAPLDMDAIRAQVAEWKSAAPSTLSGVWPPEDFSDWQPPARP